MQVRYVFGGVTTTDLDEQYWRNGVHTKTIPATHVVMVRAPLHAGAGGWKAKARVVCCGNCEPGAAGKDVGNRTEVPSTLEMRTPLALGGDTGGTLDHLM